MMKLLSSLFVGKPLSILTVAAAFLLAYVARRHVRPGSARRARSFLVVAAVWAVYAAWEWLVLALSPEANIRVDLMVIWPILLIITIWFSIRAFGRAGQSASVESERKGTP